MPPVVRRNRNKADIPQSMTRQPPPLPTVRRKVGREDFVIPSVGNSSVIGKVDFNVSQLKDMCAHYHLKKSGNKDELRTRCYSYLSVCKAVVRTQALTRGILRRKLNRLRGPGILRRRICKNEADFLTFEDTSSIHPDSYFSFKDAEENVWAFDIMSIHNHLVKSGSDALNPFTRAALPAAELTKRIEQVVTLAGTLGVKTDLEFENAPPPDPQDLEMRAQEIFQRFDIFGHFTDHRWLLSLDKQHLLDFYKALHDIWSYRADITEHVMASVCAPHGRPFAGCSWSGLCNGSRDNALKSILQVCRNFTFGAVDDHHQQLGVYYVLAALTLINPQAAESLPWLHQSVA